MAGPRRMRPADGTRGGDQSGLRQYNERLILKMIRRSDGISKAELARATGLSPQAASVIVNRLLHGGLVIKSGKIRGRVGQPSTLLHLNPDGAYSIGIKIGRRSLDVLLMNMVGAVPRRTRHSYRYPRPEDVFREIGHGVGFVLEALEPERRDRVAGAGIAMPLGLDEWAEELGAPPGELEAWRSVDVAAEVGRLVDVPVSLMNDVTAACGAELTLGTTIDRSSCLYVFIGAFVGGGIVLSGEVVSGPGDNAGALGSMPIFGALAATAGDPPEQLLRRASLLFLERRLESGGWVLETVVSGRETDRGARRIYEEWRGDAAIALAYAVTAAISVIDFETVVIDGALPRDELAALVVDVEAGMGRLDLKGLVRPELKPGSFGEDARAIGGGLIPLQAKFEPRQGLFTKLSRPAV